MTTVLYRTQYQDGNRCGSRLARGDQRGLLRVRDLEMRNPRSSQPRRYISEGFSSLEYNTLTWMHAFSGIICSILACSRQEVSAVLERMYRFSSATVAFGYMRSDWCVDVGTVCRLHGRGGGVTLWSSGGLLVMISTGTFIRCLLVGCCYQSMVGCVRCCCSHYQKE